MATVAIKSVKSKGWDWSKVEKDHWTKPSDEVIPVALRWRELNKKTVLDLGCGRGRHSLYLAGLGFDVTATDLSPQGIAQLKREAMKQKLDNKIQTLVCDMLELPFVPASFDAVLAFLSITHTNYAGLKKIIAKVTEILKGTGRFYVTFNSKGSPQFSDSSNVKVDKHTLIKRTGFEKDIPHCYLDHGDIIKLLAGYKILKMQHIYDYYGERISVHYFVEAEKKN